ncbi:hypothetical protein K432DRAFT_446699 [Lepidopterella palustris CBS 459.81]|uniref:DUF7730 domain-containing protein n=1 Tax=Lepidopterella palustris CBS 459.81 TaxID=1314670 RepID=A0A8E2E189_9PEZI|nr:hypothetical protein K432DRAFT_446699 [Lepidopterella palustris CBS 459.81]
MPYVRPTPTWKHSIKRLVARYWNLTIHIYKSCTSTFVKWTRRRQYPTLAVKYPGNRIAPTPLLKTTRRRRSLSLLRSDDSFIRKRLFSLLPSKKRTSNQAESLLFTKLPVEIRLLIWEYVIGRQTLHIVPSLIPSLTRPSRYKIRDRGIYYRLDHEVCRCESEDVLRFPYNTLEYHSPCVSWVTREGLLYFHHPNALSLEDERGCKNAEARYLRWWRRKNRVLGLLKTCRMIYIEAAPILYAANTFDFRNLETLVQFESTLLPHRFNMIRNLTIQWVFRRGIGQLNPLPGAGPLFESEQEMIEQWEMVCACLTRMTGLRNLVVLLQGPLVDSKAGWLLEPLREVVVNGRFIVLANGPETELDMRGVGEGRVPFELRRAGLEAEREKGKGTSGGRRIVGRECEID